MRNRKISGGIKDAFPIIHLSLHLITKNHNVPIICTRKGGPLQKMGCLVESVLAWALRISFAWYIILDFCVAGLSWEE